MKRSRIWLLLALLLVIALVTSGCFQIRMFKISPKSAAAGEQITVRTEAYPQGMGSVLNQPGFYFVLIGHDNVDWLGSSQIDADGYWGGPYEKGNNTGLRDLLLSGGECATHGIDAADMESTFDSWRVVVSLEAFGTDSPSTAQLALRNRTQLYFLAPAGVGAGEYGDIVLFSGIWVDDADGVPQTGEALCTGMISFSVPYTD